MNQLLCGVDAGGSKTELFAALNSSYPASTFRSTAPGIHLATTPISEVAEFLSVQIANAERETNVRCGSAALGVAGAGSPAICVSLEKELRKRLGHCPHIRVTSDGELLLALTEDRPAVAAIAGTGSFVVGRASVSAPVVRAGGWGPLLGDDGSAYRIVLDYLRLATTGLDPLHTDASFPPDLADRFPALARLLARLGLGTPGELKSTANSLAARRDIAACLVELAESNDAHAAAIVADHASRLSQQVREVVVQVTECEYELVLAGGVLVHFDDFRERVLGSLREHGCAPRRVLVAASPAEGALAIAAKHSRSS